MIKPKLIHLSNKIPVLLIDIPYLQSVTSLIAVGTGSRNEEYKNNGISHFLEHMFFKGSKKYPSTEIISTIIDGMGAMNNAWTSTELTAYWIKSSSHKYEQAIDILASMYKESLMLQEEVDREKGVITEEIKMIRDNPARHIWTLFEELQFGKGTPLGQSIIGEEDVIKSFNREDFLNYMNTWYASQNIVLAMAGNLPKNIVKLLEQNFGDLPQKKAPKYRQYHDRKKDKADVSIYYKETDQASVILGVPAYGRLSPKRYALRVLMTILGDGMSSRLFLQVRERRGLAYYVHNVMSSYLDAGYVGAKAGLRLESLEEGIKVIREELEKVGHEGVTEDELKKAKEMIRGDLALRSESTNFLAENFAEDYLFEKKIETFEEYLDKVDKVTTNQIQKIAKELFQPHRYNLQIIAPLKDTKKFERILNS